MIKIGTKVIIVDNYNEHLNYKKGKITTITGHDDYGNYILDNRWCCWPGRTGPDTYITMGLADNESKRKGLINMGLTGDTLNCQLVGNDRMERDYENASGGKPVQSAT